MAKGKRYQQARELIEQAGGGPFGLAEASALVKQTATANFDESVDIDLRLGVDPRHADQMVRGSVALPHGTGKTIRVLVFAPEGRHAEAEEAGADHVGLDEYVRKIEDEGWFEFDVAIATPDVMGQVGRLGRFLGPRGLMPNPKSGTVTNDLAATIDEVKAGRIEFRVDRQGNLHTAIGKTSFDVEKIQDNARAFLREIVRLRPASAKGLYLRSVTLSSTMGPPITVDRSAILTEVR